MLLPLHRSEDIAGLPVSFPEGMVSCKLGREPRISPRCFRRNMGLLLHLLCCCRGRKVKPWRRVGRFCWCSWSILWNKITFFSVWCASYMVFSEGMVLWSEMNCAHGSAVRVYVVCLLRPQLMRLSYVPLSQQAWCEFLLLSL